MSDLVPAAAGGLPLSAAAGGMPFSPGADGMSGTIMAPARAAQLLLWGIIAGSAALLLWAALAQVHATAVAAGRVVAAAPLQTVNHPEGGIVRAILVRPGATVARGQLLVRLDPATVSAELGRGSSGAAALAARIARLEAEVAGTSPVFAADLAATAPAAVAAERALWEAHRSDAATAVAGEAARLDGADRALVAAEAERAARGEARAQAAREAAMIAPLVEKGIMSGVALQRAQSAVALARANEAGAAAGARRAAAQVAEAGAARRAAATRLRGLAAEQLAAARAEYAALTASLPALRGRLAASEVRSPVAGTVQRVLVTTLGSAAAPGAPLVEIVPRGAALAIDAALAPGDIGFVHIGQRAAIKLTAYDSAVYGTLTGRVERISPDAIVDERSGASHFAVRVTTPATSLTAPDGMRLPIAPGMVAEVDLLGPQRSVLSWLLAPMTRLRDNAFRER